MNFSFKRLEGDVELPEDDAEKLNGKFSSDDVESCRIAEHLEVPEVMVERSGVQFKATANNECFFGRTPSDAYNLLAKRLTKDEKQESAAMDQKMAGSGASCSWDDVSVWVEENNMVSDDTALVQAMLDAACHADDQQEMLKHDYRSPSPAEAEFGAKRDREDAIQNPASPRKVWPSLLLEHDNHSHLVSNKFGGEV